MAIDPVCGMTVDPATARGGSYEHQGQTYYFCNTGCQTKFRANPESYLAKRKSSSGAKPSSVAGHENQPASATAHCCCSGHDQAAIGTAKQAAIPADKNAIYTCPMHPEIEQVGPGDCPICGMALEPKIITLEETENPELTDMSRRVWISALMAAPVVILAMGHMIPGWPFTSHQAHLTGAWVQLVLATLVVFWGGWPLLVRGVQSVLHRSPNMFTLVAMGVLAAYAYSLAAVLAPGWFPTSFRDAQGHIGLYFEAAVVIIVLVLLGQVLELRARQRTGSAIRALLGLAPKTARVVHDNGAEEDVPLEHVQVGQRLRVRPGEKVPVDGSIIQGSTAIDESMMTGESIPVARQSGDTVIGGTVNGTGSFIMEARKIGRDTLLAQIVQMVSQAQRSRAPIQRLADQVSAWFVPAVMLTAVITFVLWTLLGPAPAVVYGLVNAVAVLIIACPCALGLATPMSIMVGVGRGAQAGVLIRSAQALETLEQIDTLVVDKTGTLTEGKPSLMQVAAVPNQDETQLLAWSASLERSSEHPLAGAIVRAAADRHMPLTEASDFVSRPGLGVAGLVQGQQVAVGNQAWMIQRNVPTDSWQDRARQMEQAGQTVLWAAVNGRMAGLLGVADRIKPSTPEAIRQLQAAGVTLVMLTGDSAATAKAVADQLGIQQYHAQVLPEQKGKVIQQLQAQGRRVAMAGDGVNDAPALALAQVGIAMGTGADVAIHSAGITLLKGDLRGIVRARTLSKAVMKNIRQNLFFAFIYNALGVPLAAGILYPWAGLLLSPMIAAAAMSGSSVSVIGNALRLRKVRLDGII